VKEDEYEGYDFCLPVIFRREHLCDDKGNTVFCSCGKPGAYESSFEEEKYTVFCYECTFGTKP
jgi:hypothetical protein